MHEHRQSVCAERMLWLEGEPPFHHIPSFIIHTALYCTHIHTRCVSHCTAHRLGQGVAANVGACTSTKGDCECPACRRLFDGLLCVSRGRPICHRHWASCVSVRSAGIFCTLNQNGEKKPLNASMTHDRNLSPKFLCCGEAKHSLNSACTETWHRTGMLLHLLHFVKVYILKCV